ncbi:MAG: response regulator transcription factor, partial [Spirochaetes bacterium]|nr:response regulator transcription factor [Spirochaetota bacterium]
DDDKIFNAICRGASGYLLKSVSSENIQNFIMDVVSGGAVMNPSIAAKILKMFNQVSEPQEEYGLTTREKEILKLLVDGYTKKHIADELYISFLTVDTHVKNIYNKLHVHSQVDVVIKALKERLI